MNECIQYSSPLSKHHSIIEPRENVSQTSLWLSSDLNAVTHATTFTGLFTP